MLADILEEKRTMEKNAEAQDDQSEAMLSGLSAKHNRRCASR